jgi:hypothetical protein
MDTHLTLDALKTRIYRIRGQQIMLDADLAVLYGASTFRLNEQVKRNRRRFPTDFMFQLSDFEWKSLISQFAISKPGRGGRRHRPFAFTEQGVAMLSTVLNSERAIQVNIAIMRAFVKLRHALLAHQGIARRVEKLEGKVDMHETDIRLLVQDVDKLKKHPGPAGPINPSLL